MYIHIEGRQFFTSVFDKLLNFILLISFLVSNIPTTQAYVVYLSQLVRIGRICDKYADFKDRHLMLTRKLLKQGYRYDHLCSCVKRFYNKHVDISSKYKITVKQHIKEGIELPLSSVKG